MPIGVNLTSTPVTNSRLTVGSWELGVGSWESGVGECGIIDLNDGESGVVR